MTMALNQTRTRSLGERLRKMHWLIITLLCALAAIGVLMHFSVTDGSWTGRPVDHATRFAIILAFVVGLSLLDSRIWIAVAYPLYLVALVLLIGVELIGDTRLGAQRWLELGPLSLQPSELMKVGIVLALARYYENMDPRRTGQMLPLLTPILMIGVPTALVMHQPDLGTALLIAGSGFGMMFLAGLRWRYIIAAAAVALPGAIYAYFFVLQAYQRQRVVTFLDPDADPLGAGYHQLQSRIAIGSAGLFGQGYGEGPQSQLDFLPEKHTDFIFTMIVEEFGLIGAFLVVGLFVWLLTLVMRVSMQAKSLFARLAAGGVGITIALYVLINTSMVIGLVPVVGIPLPLLSFGGTAMLTIMAGIAIVLSIHLNRDASASRGFVW